MNPGEGWKSEVQKGGNFQEKSERQFGRSQVKSLGFLDSALPTNQDSLIIEARWKTGNIQHKNREALSL